MFDRWIIKLWLQNSNWRGKYRLTKIFENCFGTVKGVTPHGVRIEFRPIDTTYYHYFHAGHEQKLVDLIDQLPPGGVFVDVGANAGIYSIIASRRVGAAGLVVAFEAARETYSNFTKHLDLNHADNVIPFNVAVGAEEGLAEMVVSEDSGLSHLGKIERPKLEKTHRVAVVSLDRSLPALIEGRRIDLMKIDVEGAEMGVLRGAEKLFQSKAITRLHIEVLPGNLARFGASVEELYEFLEKHGYRRVKDTSSAKMENEVFEQMN